jgi:hypothetical protein
MARRTGMPKRVFGLAVGFALLAALGLSVSTASSRNQAPGGTKAFHATKDCSGFNGLVGAHCTIRSSNVKALKVGSKIFYFQQAGKTALDSDTVLYAGPGNVAIGHCFLRFANGIGLCTMSDGTGTLAGLHLRVRVTADSSSSKLWHWDGTYSLGNDSAASSGNQVRGTKAFHATKDCSGFNGLVGAYCTVRSSNVKALKVGSKIFYFQQAGKTALDSDTVLYAGPGNVAIGHCFLRFANGVGLCTMSDGTGTLAGLRLRVRVTADSSISKLWHWDGTYSFGQG